MRFLYGGLALAILACAPAAHANDLAKAKQDGGQLVLTDEAGTCQQGESVIRDLAKDTERRAGCYTLDPTTVHVRWSDNTMATFDIKKFKPTKYAEQQAERERGDKRYETPQIERSIRTIPKMPPQTG